MSEALSQAEYYLINQLLPLSKETARPLRGQTIQCCLFWKSYKTGYTEWSKCRVYELSNVVFMNFQAECAYSNHFVFKGS